MEDENKLNNSDFNKEFEEVDIPQDGSSNDFSNASNSNEEIDKIKDEIHSIVE